ncbi:MAG: protein phosphatase 2C domain-containing protein [Acidobacteria bacterium]|nr:protein phosphatase 2C domain-containing protein [Acidobacteriota bacterium]
MTENNYQMTSAAVSDRGLSEKRPQNEDSYLEVPKLGLFAVADGVGGAQAGDVASQMAMEILGEAFANLQTGGDPEEMMKVAIERANSAIYQMSSDLPQLSTMATTIVALQISGTIATIGHVGDSRLYRLDAKGSLYRETQDHSVVEEEVRAGRMTAAQAANHPSRNVISRALGAESTVEVDMKTIMFDSNTTFLLCSDGITRHINDFEIRELLLSGAAPGAICAKMKEVCYARGAEDNLTAVIVRVVTQAEDEYREPAAAVAPVDDESTVAAARPQPAAPVQADSQHVFDEIPTRDLQMPASMQAPEAAAFAAPTEAPVYSHDDDESYLMDEPEEAHVEPPPPTQEFVPAAVAPAPVPEPAQPAQVRAKEIPTYEPEPKSGGGSRFLSSILLLLVGAILGVAGYYGWLMMNAKPADGTPPIQQMQSPNPPFYNYENVRRTVDANPKAIIAQYTNTPPKDAADYYFLGRAQLLNRNYEEAKRTFLDARNKLKDYTEAANKSVLENDINIGLAIAEEKAAQTAFEKESQFSKTPPAGETNPKPNQ